MNSKQVFEILMRENMQMLLTYLRATVKAPHLVDEIFQETMLTAWQKLDDFDTSRLFAPWLRGIAKNHILTHYRKSKREMLLGNDELLNFIEQKIHLIEQQPGDNWSDKIAPLHTCIKALPEKYREAIEARYIHEQKPATITRELNVPAETIKKRLQRAKKNLFTCLNNKLTAEVSL